MLEATHIDAYIPPPSSPPQVAPSGPTAAAVAGADGRAGGPPQPGVRAGVKQRGNSLSLSLSLSLYFSLSSLPPSPSLSFSPSLSRADSCPPFVCPLRPPEGGFCIVRHRGQSTRPIPKAEYPPVVKEYRPCVKNSGILDAALGSLHGALSACIPN